MSEKDSTQLEQRDPRQTYTCKGVRGDAIFAFRKMLSDTGQEEGEVLSKLFEAAVENQYGGAGPAELGWFKEMYRETLEHDK